MRPVGWMVSAWLLGSGCGSSAPDAAGTAPPAASSPAVSTRGRASPLVDRLVNPQVISAMTDAERAALKQVGTSSQAPLFQAAQRVDQRAEVVASALAAELSGGQPPSEADIQALVTADVAFREAVMATLAEALRAIGPEGRAQIFGARARPGEPALSGPGDLLVVLAPFLHADRAPLSTVLEHAGLKADAGFSSRDEARRTALVTRLEAAARQLGNLDPARADFGALVGQVLADLGPALEASTRARLRIAADLIASLPADQAARLLSDPGFSDYAGLTLGGANRARTGPAAGEATPGGGPPPRGPDEAPPRGAGALER